jgi:hypothetical protein
MSEIIPNTVAFLTVLISALLLAILPITWIPSNFDDQRETGFVIKPHNSKIGKPRTSSRSDSELLKQIQSI